MARSTLPAARPDVAEKVVTGGVDTHLDVHVVAALDRIGGLLGTACPRPPHWATRSCSTGC